MVRGGVAVFGTLSVVAAAMFVRYQLAARTTGPGVDERWRELRARYEWFERNESARRLEEIAAGLGLDLELHWIRRHEAVPPVKPLPEDFEPIGDFVGSAAIARADEILPVPAPVSGYLDAHRPLIDAVVRHLAEEPLPRWPTDLDAIVPPYLPADHVWALGNLLQADVLARQQRGDHAGALRALDAFWALRAALAFRPEDLMTGDVMAVHATRLLTRMEPPPHGWGERLKTIAPHRTVGEALELTGFRQAARLRPVTERKGDEWVQGAVRDYAIAMRRTAAELATLAPCAVDGWELKRRMWWRLGLWNFPGYTFLPDLGQWWERANHVAVEVELASKVLDLKARRDAEHGFWPAAVAGIESSVCAGASWSYAAGGDGRITLILSRGFQGDRPPSFTTVAGRPH